jgi:putative ABC transport system permease protein
MKKLTIFDLIAQNLKRNPLRACALAAIVAAFACMLFAGTFISGSASYGAALLAERLGADILLVPYGYEGKMQGSLLRGEPSSFYLDGSLADKLQNLPGVDKVSPQLFVATLNAACCTLPVQLIGFDPQSDFIVRPWLNSLGQRELGDTEILAGSKIIGDTGETIVLFGKEFSIAGKLEPTGMGFDTSIFLPISRARRLLLLSELAEQPQFVENTAGLKRDSFISSVLIKARNPAEAKTLANSILEQYAVEYKLDFVLVAGMVSSISARIKLISAVLYGLAAGLWLLALAVLSLVFSMALNERRKELGILRCIGATRRSLAGMVLGEALCISASGALLGIVIACGILLPFSAYIQSSLQMPALRPEFSALLQTGLGSFALALLTGPLSCVYALARLNAKDAYLFMKESR